MKYFLAISFFASLFWFSHGIYTGNTPEFTVGCIYFIITVIVILYRILSEKKQWKLTPCIFAGVYPLNSILQNSESEKIAQNVLRILKRTGNTFRELTWEEYFLARKKDEKKKLGPQQTAWVINRERKYFDKVSYLAKGDEAQLINFSPEWNKMYYMSKLGYPKSALHYF